MAVVRVANHHKGPIIFPRSVNSEILPSPICIYPGSVEEIDAGVWGSLKSSPQITHYLNAGILSEVRRDGNVPVYEERTSDPPVPENLQYEEQTGAAVTASVKRAKRGSVDA